MKYIDNPRLLELRFSNGMLILPFFYGRIMAKLNNQSFSGDGMKPPSRWKIISARIKALKKAWPCKADILTWTSTRWETKENGCWKNIQHGYYYDLFPDNFLMLEEPDLNYKWKTFETREPMSTVNQILVQFSNIYIRFYKLFYKVHSKDFDIFHDFYPFIEIEEIVMADYVVKVQHKLWRLLLKKIKPKVILMHCGSYGSIPGIICKTAHELGMIPIDTQHGQVYQHKIYMASDTIRNSKEYMEYMPDYFYSFGQYWSDCVDWKYEKINVGNAHLNKFVKQYSGIEPTHDMLVISQPTEKQQQHEFIIDLAKAFPSKEIRVRLHPFENIDVEKAVFKEYPNIVVSDSSVNLYADMCSCKKVIGWCSTCLSELLAFGRMPIIVNTSLAKDTFPHNLGYWINSPSEIANIPDGPVDIDPTKYWYQDFDEAVKLHMMKLLTK